MAENDKDGKGAFMYYVNDGVYGSFNSLLYDHASVEARLVNVRNLLAKFPRKIAE